MTEKSYSFKSIAKQSVLSGAEKLKRRKIIERDNAKLAITASKYFKPNKSSTNSDPIEPNEVEDQIIQNSLQSHAISPNVAPIETELNRVDTDDEVKDKDESQQSKISSFEYSDPSTWPNPMNSNIHAEILEKGPTRTFLENYTKLGKYSFKNEYFTKIVDSRDRLTRDWLLYSSTTNSLFCFPCCLFLKPHKAPSPWSNFGDGKTGFNDFHHQHRGISSHEDSQIHFTTTITWKEYMFNRRNGNIIDQSIQHEMIKEVSFWKEVLRGVLDGIMFLARNNLAFLGTSTNIEDRNCGNFLSLIKLLSKYNPTLAVHLNRLEKGKVSYFSPKIQNEFISLAGSSVRNSIMQNITERRFFSIMFDATPDAAHMEQISEIIRTVNISETGCFIEENFIDFIHYDGKTGELLSKEILRKLELDGLNINNCRGQGYDNGSNMSGIYQGVQARICERNALAYFVPCAAHSLNLVGHNAATKVLPGKLILGQIQNIYTFFSGSPSRWTVLKTHVKKTLKNQSTTRWASKADSVDVMYNEFKNISEALIEIINSEDFNAQTVADANSRFNEIWSFKFIFGLTIWNSVLARIQITNLALQMKGIEIAAAEKHLSGLVKWIETFKIYGFNKCNILASEKAMALGIDLNSGFNYRLTRGTRPSRFRDDSDGEPISNVEKFENEFFIPMIDNLLSEFRKRFQSIRDAANDFGFLWGERLLTNDPHTFSESIESSKNLSRKYGTDLNKIRFISELQFLKSAVTPFLKDGGTGTSALDILNILTKNGLQEQFVNCHTALRIFLTLPVSVASNERAFSKLKIIKSYLRSSMAQDRLSNLAILSIESEYAEKMCFESIIHEFATTKCRKVDI